MTAIFLRNLVGVRGFETSDPCLPKTVLYQAELHSDRAGRHSQGAGALARGAYGPIRPVADRPPPPARPAEGRARHAGADGEASRERVRSTGVVAEEPAAILAEHDVEPPRRPITAVPITVAHSSASPKKIAP